MRDAKSYDGLLTANHTLDLLEMLRGGPPRAFDQAIRDFAILKSASHSRTRNTILVLIELHLLDETEAGLVASHSLPGDRDKVRDHISRVIAVSFVNLLRGYLGPSPIRQGNVEKGIWLDSRLAPGSDRGLPFLIAEFGVAQRQNISSYVWRISPDFEEMVLVVLAEENTARLKKSKRTIEQLKASLAIKEKYGEEAEVWVVNFERKRLSGHALIEQIQRISEINVSAGFDIYSFSSTSVLSYDRFIEVKSHGGDMHFFWTQNEIETARELRDRYFLYLVDRTRLSEPDYAPVMISAPHEKIFLEQQKYWNAVPVDYECWPFDAPAPMADQENS